MSGAASALFLLDIKGRVLIWRDYRGDVTAAQAERFFTKLIDREVNISSSFSTYRVRSTRRVLFFILFSYDRISIWYAICYLLIYLVILQDDPQSQDPVMYENGVTYMFIQHSNVYLMSASRQNCNAASHLLFLHRIVDVSKPVALRFLFDSETCCYSFRSKKIVWILGGFLVVVTCIRFCRCLSIILKS